jgi:nucleoside-diphosphate-sugar epimerase
MKTAFVTGGTGFVGLNLVALLKEQGWRVIAIHRKSSNTKYLSALGPELRECGIDDTARLVETMPEGVDTVFHVAGDISWWRGHDARLVRTNVDGTRHVVEAALARKAKRLVHTSSVAAFGLGHDVVSERTPSSAAASPLAYVRTKWLGEEEVKKAIAKGLDAVILNPGNIVGPFDTTSWARLFQMLKRGKLPGVPPGSGSYVHAREVARAHIEAATKGATGEQWLLGGADATYAELVSIMAELMGVKAPRAIPAWILRTMGIVNDGVSRVTRKEPDITAGNATLVCSRWSIDSAKAERDLGLARVPLRTMVEDSYKWLAAEGLL